MDATTEDELRATAEHLTDKAKEVASDLAEKGRHWVDRASECVRERPGTYLLAALGVGALASFLLCRRA